MTIHWVNFDVSRIFATRPLDLRLRPAVLRRHAMHHFRSGDIVAGCSTARAAHHLHRLTVDQTREFVDWILLQQLPNGGYARNLGITEELAGVDLDLQLRLPTTLACLWTVIELST
ncbi:MAG: hypothetical protein ACXW3S_11310, partial [Rhodoplanes sp.]